MATPDPISQAVQVRILWSDPIRNFMNVCHAVWAASGPLAPGVGDTLFTALKGSAATTAWMSLLPTTTVLTGVDVRDLRVQNAPLLPSTSAGVPGSVAATFHPLPPQSSMVVTLRTASAGRAFRGRVYLGGLSNAVDDGTGRILPAANAAAVAFVQAVNAAIVSSGGTVQGILQRALPERPAHGGGTLPARPGAIVPVTAWQSRDNVYDTQRRRSGVRIGSR